MGTRPNHETKFISVTPTVSAGAAYASGDAVGGLMSFTGAAKPEIGTAMVGSVILQDLNKQDAELDLILFDSNPSATTFTDNAVLDIADADLARIIGVVTVAATDYADFNDSAVGFVSCSVPFRTTATGSALDLTTQTLYGALVTRGAPTYNATTDVTVKLGVMLD